MKNLEFNFFDQQPAAANDRADGPEEWAEFPGAPGYMVSTEGRFKNSKGKCILGSANHNGYIHIGPSIGGKQVVQLAHRVVARAFHEKPDGLDLVNHKNRNKHDNRAANLEWTNASMNTLHWRRSAA
jgi:hypothetical protein